MFQFLTHVKLSRSMAAILEIPQYVAYQKIVALYISTTVENLQLLTKCAQFTQKIALAALLNRFSRETAFAVYTQMSHKKNVNLILVSN